MAWWFLDRVWSTSIPRRFWASLTACSQPHCTTCYAPLLWRGLKPGHSWSEVLPGQGYLHYPEIPEGISFVVDGQPGLLLVFLTFRSCIRNRQKLGRASLTFSSFHEAKDWKMGLAELPFVSSVEMRAKRAVWLVFSSPPPGPGLLPFPATHSPDGPALMGHADRPFQSCS